MRVLIADQHVIFREFLKSFFARIPEFQVAGEASDGLEAVELVDRLKPDLVLMDIEMPRMDGLEAARRIKAHNDETSVILLSAVDDDAHRRAAHRSGADAFLPKDARMGSALGKFVMRGRKGPNTFRQPRVA
jgi:two-component system, NarL family, response regulator DegU